MPSIPLLVESVNEKHMWKICVEKECQFMYNSAHVFKEGVFVMFIKRVLTVVSALVACAVQADSITNSVSSGKIAAEAVIHIFQFLDSHL